MSGSVNSFMKRLPDPAIYSVASSQRLCAWRLFCILFVSHLRPALETDT